METTAEPTRHDTARISEEDQESTLAETTRLEAFSDGAFAIIITQPEGIKQNAPGLYHNVLYGPIHGVEQGRVTAFGPTSTSLKHQARLKALERATVG